MRSVALAFAVLSLLGVSMAVRSAAESSDPPTAQQSASILYVGEIDDEATARCYLLHPNANFLCSRIRRPRTASGRTEGLTVRSVAVEVTSALAARGFHVRMVLADHELLGQVGTISNQDWVYAADVTRRPEGTVECSVARARSAEKLERFYGFEKTADRRSLDGPDEMAINCLRGDLVTPPSTAWKQKFDVAFRDIERRID